MLKGELFSTEMVRALLDGRKLHTARPVKKKYDNTHFEYRTDKYGTEFVEMQNDIEGETFGKNSDGTTWRKLRGYIVPKPKYRPGDYMYVRETWGIPIGLTGKAIIYKADFDDDCSPLADGEHWRPSIHMPREAARLFYRVTKVDVMRLDDVDEQFALEDGFLDDYEARAQGLEPENALGDYMRARMKFMDFWRRQYESNARWTWVYWMEQVSKEEATNDR